MAEIAIRELESSFHPPELILRSVKDLVKAKGHDWDKLSAGTKRALYERVLPHCKYCELWSGSRGPVLPMRNNMNPKAVFVGRNPGKGDDKNSDLFSTEASGGLVFAKYLKTLGLQRGDIYVTNVVMCRTKKNGPPTTQQTSMCSGWNLVELSFVEIPRYVFLMGNDALRMFFGQDFPAVQRVYGDLYLSSLFGKKTLFIPVQHPGFIVRNPEEADNTMTLLTTVERIMEDPRRFNLPWDSE